MQVRLFSPQAYFHHCPNHNGSFTISWSKLHLTLDNGKVHNGKPIKDILPCFIDKHSFLPMLTCFHDADKVALNLSSDSGCITNNSNNLSPLQTLLLHFHFKLGHIGFQHLQWLLNSGIFGPLGIQCSSKDVTPPKWQSCIQGGQHC